MWLDCETKHGTNVRLILLENDNLFLKDPGKSSVAQNLDNIGHVRLSGITVSFFYAFLTFHRLVKSYAYTP